MTRLLAWLGHLSHGDWLFLGMIAAAVATLVLAALQLYRIIRWYR